MADLKENKSKNSGRILALLALATVAGVFVWGIVSKDTASAADLPGAMTPASTPHRTVVTKFWPRPTRVNDAPMICPDEVVMVGKCGTPQKVTLAGQCSIEVYIHSGGEPFPADLTGWADGNQIDRAMYIGPFKPHDGVVYLPVDCAFAGGNKGSICMGHAVGFAANLSAVWFADARRNVANPERFDPEGRVILNSNYVVGHITFS